MDDRGSVVSADLVVVGGRRKVDPPSLLLFGCQITEDKVMADAYLVLKPLRKGTKPRLEDVEGRVVIDRGLKPGFIKFETISLSRVN